ncbi:ShlB/FhaC/HecB family hemolysin secretion/activation protein [Calothrix sp. FACHB-1219]|uniref:ShlB/FhaC/HecB family hemolysin secretion/activation protein n=1 Tax=unclassified Calothrix TaxID=2619626 RepID=UPI0016829178|nr:MULTISPECIES: ShlB/FhaC/HecB family hemolysin secretion/activation protein [unclassified Calothrix]MBD2207424.1 ShlB/FhaC/HecB family hemolysin secretion/activation protein [Calothrix sp. FACHB-168]MBD2222000.1 ShlB/FhaC/HecB family hemolysin secretion/activation protein [Calothrix sp. FACHB-1219]
MINFKYNYSLPIHKTRLHGKVEYRESQRGYLIYGIIFGAIATLFSPGVFAQTTTITQIPSPVTPTVPEPPPTPVRPPEEQPLGIPSPSQTQPKPIPIPGTFIIKQIEFSGNTAFSNQELITDKNIQQLLNQPITFTQLLQIEEIINKKYQDAGYINSGAVIPAGQKFPRRGGTLKIQIVEGGIEAIKVRGMRRLNPGYISSRLALATKKPLNRNHLLEALQLLQLDPLIQNISANLTAGVNPELSLLEVTVVEADSFSTRIFADNGRAPSVGTFRRGIQINERNLLGWGDGIRATYTNTDGSNAWEIGYIVPLSPRNETITFNYSRNNTEVIEAPFDRLDILGDSSAWEISLRLPLLQKPSQEFALGLTLSQQESKTKLLGFDFPLSPGADENGRTRISALRFFQEWTTRNPREVFAVRSQFNIGIDAFNATTNNTPPDTRFFSWRTQGQYVRLLAPETLLLLRSDLQLAGSSLVPLEQFAIGGFGSVRGYRQDLLLTDNGAFLSAEVQIPILRVPESRGILRIAPFIDFGVGWNSSTETRGDTNTLLATGLGLQWQMGNSLDIRLDWGIPLIDGGGGKKTLQENGLYFSVNYSPF